jgi:hypothetical protein
LDSIGLLEYRKREQGGSDGALLRKLRHSYLEKLEASASAVAKATSLAQRQELERQFHDDIADDMRLLKEELRLETGGTLGSKDIIAAVVGAIGVIAGAVLGHPIVGAMAFGTGLIPTIGGLLGTQSKFAQSRRKILQSHPMAYLYEMTGDIRV